MPTNFPASNDTFDTPSTPITTPLGTAGDSSRTHTQNHRDLGDALVAMQGQQTLKAHTHNGSTFRHGSKLTQANTHQSPDTDSGTGSLHHTIGTGANQYASGTHTHPAVATYPVGAFFFAWVATYPGVTDPVLGTPGLGLVGTWTAVGQRFLCASGGALGFALGATGGSNSHGHSIDASTNSTGTHSHTLSSGSTSSNGSHAHSAGGLASTAKTHGHTLSTYSTTHAIATGSGTGGTPTIAHAHSAFSSSPSHSHSAPATDSQGDHTHSVTTSLGSSSTHSHTNSTPQSANNLLPLFVVYMWKRAS